MGDPVLDGSSSSSSTRITGQRFQHHTPTTSPIPSLHRYHLDHHHHRSRNLERRERSVQKGPTYSEFTSVLLVELEPLPIPSLLHPSRPIESDTRPILLIPICNHPVNCCRVLRARRWRFSTSPPSQFHSTTLLPCAIVLAVSRATSPIHATHCHQHLPSVLPVRLIPSGRA